MLHSKSALTVITVVLSLSANVFATTVTCPATNPLSTGAAFSKAVITVGVLPQFPQYPASVTCFYGVPNGNVYPYHVTPTPVVTDNWIGSRYGRLTFYTCTSTAPEDCAYTLPTESANA